MANKLVAGILVLLVLLTAGIGYYSFTLNGQVNRLNERIATFESEQSARVSAVSDNLAALSASTETSLASLQSGLADTRADVDAARTDLTARITGAESQLSGVSSQVTSLGKQVASDEATLSGLSGAIVDAADIYVKAVQATVRITNGEDTIGSGFIYDTAGHVVTAYHVVNGLSPILVMLYDGRVSKASVTGYCPFSDVAVLKLDINPAIDPIPLGNSGQISVGEPVIAIGSPGDGDNPLGLRDTLTSGIVSALNRYENVEGNYFANLVQFDTAVNFGNSGGPLIDSAGHVVGVVNARIDPTKGDGISWAIESNKVKRVADSILTSGSFAYPWFGVGLTDITPDLVTQKSLKTSNGTLITSVVNSTPGQAAGLKTGDIITSIDGVSIRDTADFTSYLGEFKTPGDVSSVQILRGSTTLTLSVTVGTRPS